MGEWSVVDEVDTGPAASPSTGLRTPPDGVLTEAGETRLSDRDYPVVTAQLVLEHFNMTTVKTRSAPSTATWA
jgi:hypothetical protein